MQLTRSTQKDLDPITCQLILSIPPLWYHELLIGANQNIIGASYYILVRFGCDHVGKRCFKLIMYFVTAVRLHAIEEAFGRCDGSQTRVSDGLDQGARRLPEAFQQVQRGDGGAAHWETLELIHCRESLILTIFVHRSSSAFL